MPTRSVKETIFNNLDDEKLVDVLNLEFIEAMFGEDQTTSAQAAVNGNHAASPPSPSSSATSSATATNILDAKKLQNVAIMRRKLGKSIADVMTAVHALDLNFLTADEVEILLRMTKISNEEQPAFEQYVQENGGITGLSLDEQFVWKLQNIERVDVKLRLMAFMSECAEMSTFVLLPFMLSLYHGCTYV